MSRTILADLMLLAAAVIWGGGFVAGKMALTGLTPFGIMSWRFCLSAALGLAVFHRRMAATPRRTLLRGLLVGLIQFTALSLQLFGLRYTTSARQSFLCTTYVAMTPFVSWLMLRVRPGTRSVLAGFLSLVGIGMISLDSSFRISYGDLLSLSFPVLFSIQIVLVGRFAQDDTDPIQFTLWQLVSAGFLSLLLCLLLGEPLRPSGTECVGGILYLAIFNTCVAFMLQNTAQKHTGPTTAALLMSLESVFGFLFSVSYYHTPVTPRFLLGGALCFIAILIDTALPANTSAGRSSAA